MSVADFRGRSCIIPVIVAGALIAAGVACAQTPSTAAYPSKPVEFIVHTSPGGGTDVFARAVADIITRNKLVAQPVNVMNRPGGGGIIAFNYVKSRRGDPHTVLTIATGSLLTAASRPDLALGLDTYTLLSFFALDPQTVTVRADSRFETFKDLVDAARREPNTIVAAVASAGGTARLALYLIERETGARFKFVSFKGGADAVLAVLGGHVAITTENMSEMYPHVAARKMRVLAVTGEKRLAQIPDVPTLRELGYSVSVGTGRGFAMPAGVPKEAVAAMEAVLGQVHGSPAWKEHAARHMYEDMYMGGAEFADYLARRREEMRDFLAHIGIVQKP